MDSTNRHKREPRWLGQTSALASAVASGILTNALWDYFRFVGLVIACAMAALTYIAVLLARHDRWRTFALIGQRIGPPIAIGTAAGSSVAIVVQAAIETDNVVLTTVIAMAFAVPLALCCLVLYVAYTGNSRLAPRVANIAHRWELTAFGFYVIVLSFLATLLLIRLIAMRPYVALTHNVYVDVAVCAGLYIAAYLLTTYGRNSAFRPGWRGGMGYAVGWVILLGGGGVVTLLHSDWPHHRPVGWAMIGLGLSQGVTVLATHIGAGTIRGWANIVSGLCGGIWVLFSTWPEAVRVGGVTIALLLVWAGLRRVTASASSVDAPSSDDGAQVSRYGRKSKRTTPPGTRTKRPGANKRTKPRKMPKRAPR